MRRSVRLLLICVLLVLMSGCGKKAAEAEKEPASTKHAEEKTEAGTAGETETKMKPEAETETKTETKTKTETAAVHPYAWLGLQDMPSCEYLDILAAGHYLRVYDSYAGGFTTETTEAVDGMDSYSASGDSRNYSIGGIIYAVNDRAKFYLEQDITGLVEAGNASMKAAMADGTNIKGREYQGSGQGIIPLYSAGGDDSEYEYYEYLTDGSVGEHTNKLTERYYMKDGDVFAIYQKVNLGSIETEMTEVIKSITGEIPEGMLVLPVLEGYEKK